MGMIIAMIVGGIIGHIVFHITKYDNYLARLFYGIVASVLTGYIIANIERYIYG